MSTKKISAHYRPDIDGLRAIAVISVLLFHLMIRPALGGFVGVDIFFVISGYLIGNIVLGEVAEGRFSLRAFYERRFRRILPALFVMMLATLAILVATAYPVSLAQYSRNAMAAVFSVSNIYFWRMSGYFDAASNQNFLLHTWSLGVEEQFYLLFPPLVMAIGRFAKGRVVAILGLLAVVSFLASVWLVGHAPSAGFYLLPSRAWELLLGTLAGRVRFNWLAAPVQRNLVALAGAVAVLAPIVAYREATPVPGVAALLPCLGTAMIIVSGGHGETLVSRVLSARPAVFVGLISYSLYLWHWPLLVLAQELKPAPYLGRFEKLAVLALSFGCAILSWRYVERPFRGGAAASSILRTTGIAAASATALLGGLILAAGLPGCRDVSIPSRSAMPPMAISVEWKRFASAAASSSRTMAFPPSIAKSA